MKVKSLSRLRLFATPWTVAHQASTSMEFSRQEYWSGLPFPSPGDLPSPGIEPGSHTLQADALPSKPILFWKMLLKKSLEVQWFGLCVSMAEGMGSIPGWGTKIPHAMWCAKKKTNSSCQKKRLEKQPRHHWDLNLNDHLIWISLFILSFITVLYFFHSTSQFSSVSQSCTTLCNPMNYSMPDFSVHHLLPQLAQIHAHWVSDAIQLSHPLSSPSPPTFNLSQHQGLFQ